MKVFPVDLNAAIAARGERDSATGESLNAWAAPITLPAIHRATVSALAKSGALSHTITGADAILIEVVDRFAPNMGPELVRLAAQAAPMAGGLVVRLHGALRDGPIEDPREVESGLGTVLGSIQDHADWVLMGSRSHLVRLACAGPFDSTRVRLVPASFEAARARQRPGSEVLVCGETHRAALEPVLEMLRGAKGPGSRASGTLAFTIARSARSLAQNLPSAGAALIPAVCPFGDRSLTDAIIGAGIPVVASELACRIDEPLPEGLFTVEAGADPSEWQAALTAAQDWRRLGPGPQLTSPEAPGPGTASNKAALAAQMAFFREVCAPSSGHQTAA